MENDKSKPSYLNVSEERISRLDNSLLTPLGNISAQVENDDAIQSDEKISFAGHSQNLPVSSFAKISKGKKKSSDSVKKKQIQNVLASNDAFSQRIGSHKGGSGIQGKNSDISELLEGDQ